MTPDQQFARWVKGGAIAFALLFAYFLLADLKMPLTPQAMATRGVVKVAPQVSGRLMSVHVRNNQSVHKGDLLFELDPAPFRLAVEQAQLALEQARQENARLDANIAAADADLSAANTRYQLAERQARRVNALYERHLIAQQQKEDADGALRTAQAALEASQATLVQLKVSRGESGEANLRLRQAHNNLERATLNLAYSRVSAEQDGVVTNLQLEQGAYAAAGSPLLALVADQLEVIADFREKALRGAEQGDRALVVFDGRPGSLYPAHIDSLDAGVSAGQFDANGQLATPTQSDRWVRDAQRLRLRLHLDEVAQTRLPSGARATVQLLPENPLLALLARAQITLISLLHYIY